MKKSNNEFQITIAITIALMLAYGGTTPYVQLGNKSSSSTNLMLNQKGTLLLTTDLTSSDGITKLYLIDRNTQSITFLQQFTTKSSGQSNNNLVRLSPSGDKYLQLLTDASPNNVIRIYNRSIATTNIAYIFDPTPVQTISIPSNFKSVAYGENYVLVGYPNLVIVYIENSYNGILTLMQNLLPHMHQPLLTGLDIDGLELSADQSVISMTSYSGALKIVVIFQKSASAFFFHQSIDYSVYLSRFSSKTYKSRMDKEAKTLVLITQDNIIIFHRINTQTTFSHLQTIDQCPGSTEQDALVSDLGDKLMIYCIQQAYFYVYKRDILTSLFSLFIPQLNQRIAISGITLSFAHYGYSLFGHISSSQDLRTVSILTDITSFKVLTNLCNPSRNCKQCDSSVTNCSLCYTSYYTQPDNSLQNSCQACINRTDIKGCKQCSLNDCFICDMQNGYYLTNQLCETENLGVRIGLSVGLGVGFFLVFVLTTYILIRRYRDGRKVHNSGKSEQTIENKSNLGDQALPQIKNAKQLNEIKPQIDDSNKAPKFDFFNRRKNKPKIKQTQKNVENITTNNLNSIINAQPQQKEQSIGEFIQAADID